MIYVNTIVQVEKYYVTWNKIFYIIQPIGQYMDI